MAVLLEEMIKSVELWLKLIRKPQPYVNPDLDPVLLVPGIAGSVLHAVDGSSNREERVWVRIFQADYKFRTRLWSRFDHSTGAVFFLRILLMLAVALVLDRVISGRLRFICCVGSRMLDLEYG